MSGIGRLGGRCTEVISKVKGEEDVDENEHDEEEETHGIGPR